MDHSKVRKIIRKYLNPFRYYWIPIPDDKGRFSIPRNDCRVDDLIYYTDRSWIVPEASQLIIVEYKTEEKPSKCLKGIGQLLYYSTEMDISKCCLCLSKVAFNKAANTLHRLDWLGVLVYDNEEVLVVNWPDSFGPRPIPRPELPVKPVDMDKANQEALEIVTRVLGSSSSPKST